MAGIGLSPSASAYSAADNTVIMGMAWTKNLLIALLKKDFILMLALLLHSNAKAVYEGKKKL